MTSVRRLLNPKFRDLSKETFGRVKPLRKIRTKHDCALWECRCYCGNLFESTSGELTRTTKPRVSCGRCYDVRKYPTEYNTWRRMKQRCYNKDCEDYKNYGGRGITVCERWRKDFLFFLEDMGFRPKGDYSIERREVNGNYEPNNCKWAGRFEQNRNRRCVK